MRYVCEKCGREYDLTEKYIGVPLECQCGNKFTVASSAANPNLMACPDCGSMVSKKAHSCPKCGSPFQSASASMAFPSARTNAPIRVDTGENFLNRNRGCADLIIYGPLAFIILGIVLAIIVRLYNA